MLISLSGKHHRRPRSYRRRREGMLFSSFSMFPLVFQLFLLFSPVLFSYVSSFFSDVFFLVFSCYFLFSPVFQCFSLFPSAFFPLGYLLFSFFSQRFPYFPMFSNGAICRLIIGYWTVCIFLPLARLSRATEAGHMNRELNLSLLDEVGEITKNLL